MKTIVFEGIDGAGKTTAAQRFCNYLDSYGITNKYIKLPTAIGRKKVFEQDINGDQYKIFNIFYEDYVEAVENTKHEEEVIVLDRSMFSSLAYQGCRDKALLSYMRNQIDLLAPADLLVFLDISKQDAEFRIKQRGNAKDGYEQTDLQIYIDRYEQELSNYKYNLFRLPQSNYIHFNPVHCQTILETLHKQ